MTPEEKIVKLEAKLALYEQNGAAKMYYALQRKMNEIGNLFNNASLNDINLDDPKDKSFDRIFKLIEKSETIANAANALKAFGGITGDESADVAKKPFVDTIAIARN
mgnify:CR=1 FL=1